MRHLIDPLDLTVEELDRLLRLGEDIRREPGAYSESCKGKKLATLFYEPSTRLAADIFAQPQKSVQLFHGKVQRVDQMAHIHSLQESLAGTAAARGLLQAAR